jgi:hypothetical protein
MDLDNNLHLKGVNSAGESGNLVIFWLCVIIVISRDMGTETKLLALRQPRSQTWLYPKKILSCSFYNVSLM